MAKQKTCAAKASVGGQALIEGVMMNGPQGSALAVRHTDGRIITEPVEFRHVKDKVKLLGVPFIRGVVNYIETMIFGYKCLMRSADLSGQMEADEDPEKMSKMDRWLNDHMGPKFMGAVTAVLSVIVTAISVFLFVYLPTLLVDLADEHLLASRLADFHPLLEGILRAIIIVVYMFLVSRLKDIHRVFMYHGAEHKTIFCYEKGLELTVENVRRCNRFHHRCGTSFIFIIIIINIIVSSIVALIFPILQDHSMRLIWMVVKIFGILPVVTAISYEMLKYAGRHTNVVTKIFSAPGLWMQRITTAEPTDDMIEVGIASLKGALYGVEAEPEKPEAPEPEEKPTAEEKPAADNE